MQEHGVNLGHHDVPVVVVSERLGGQKNSARMLSTLVSYKYMVSGSLTVTCASFYGLLFTVTEPT